jgi:hypothetical protein
VEESPPASPANGRWAEEEAAPVEHEEQPGHKPEPPAPANPEPAEGGGKEPPAREPRPRREEIRDEDITF